MIYPHEEKLLRALADDPRDLFQLEKVCGKGLLSTLRRLNERGFIVSFWSRFAITDEGRDRIGLRRVIKV
jgi:hypothetical protein